MVSGNPTPNSPFIPDGENFLRYEMPESDKTIFNSFEQHIKRLYQSERAFRDLAGFMLATIKLNRDRGILTCPVGEKEFDELLKAFQESYARADIINPRTP